MFAKDSYVHYESFVTWQLYLEFRSIPGNLIDIELEPGRVLTTETMRGLLNTAYKLAGRPEMTRTH